MTDLMPWEEASQYVNPLSLIESPSRKTCEVKGCNRDFYGRGYCKSHHSRWFKTGDAGGPFRKPTHIERFSKFVDTSAGPDACHIWTGHLRNEYPSFRVAKTMVTATRWILGVVIGRELVPGEEACHHCDNPTCVNPKHLYVGSHTDNMRDALERGRHRNPVAERRRAQTHCINNHEFDEANTYYPKDGGRACRACGAASARRSKARRAAASQGQVAA